jgi:hypothetical protein
MCIHKAWCYDHAISVHNVVRVFAQVVGADGGDTLLVYSNVTNECG